MKRCVGNFINLSACFFFPASFTLSSSICRSNKANTLTQSKFTPRTAPLIGIKIKDIHLMAHLFRTGAQQYVLYSADTTVVLT